MLKIFLMWVAFIPVPIINGTLREGWYKAKVGEFGANEDEGGEKNPIYAIIITVVNWLAGLVGVAVVGGILYGGFLYTAARDNAGQTQKAITIIVDAIIGLILYAMLYTIINFLVPGGLFSS